MSTLALQKTSSNSWQIAPQSMAEMFRYSEMIAQSSFCPKEMRGRPGDVLAAIQMGAELGISAMQSLQNIAVINGKPSIYGDLMLALVLAEPTVVDVEERYNEDKTVAYCKVTRKRGDRERVTERSFSVAEAIQAKLWKKAGPWTDYPTRMLMFRARGWALRDACPDILKGLITREEAMDYPITEVRATVVDSKPSTPPSNATDHGSAAANGGADDPKTEVVTDPSPIIKYRGHPKNGKRMSELDARSCLALILRLERDAATDPGAMKWPELPAYIAECKAYAATKGVAAYTKEELARLSQLQAAVNDGTSPKKQEMLVEQPDEDWLNQCVYPDEKMPQGVDPADIRKWNNVEWLLEYGQWLATERANIGDKEQRIERVEARVRAIMEAESDAADAAAAAKQAAKDAVRDEDEADDPAHEHD